MEIEQLLAEFKRKITIQRYSASSIQKLCENFVKVRNFDKVGEGIFIYFVKFSNCKFFSFSNVPLRVLGADFMVCVLFGVITVIFSSSITYLTL